MCTLSPTIFLLPIFLGAVHAQATTAFTDPITGISFQRFFGARTQFSFGIALPQNPTTDFIGQLSFPTPSGSGWGGISLTGDMEGPLLLAAWPNGNTVISSFRIAEDEDESPPVANGAFSVLPIPEGTLANGTHMMLTFLCQGCIDGSLGFTAGDTLGTFEMGWALADRAVSNAADPATELSFHNSGFGSFDAQLSLARDVRFGEWAAMAGVASNGSAIPVVAPTPGTGGNLVSGGDDGDDDDDDDEEVEGGKGDDGDDD